MWPTRHSIKIEQSLIIDMARAGRFVIDALKNVVNGNLNRNRDGRSDFLTLSSIPLVLALSERVVGDAAESVD